MIKKTTLNHVVVSAVVSVVVLVEVVRLERGGYLKGREESFRERLFSEETFPPNFRI